MYLPFGEESAPPQLLLVIKLIMMCIKLYINVVTLKCPKASTIPYMYLHHLFLLINVLFHSLRENLFEAKDMEILTKGLQYCSNLQSLG